MDSYKDSKGTFFEKLRTGWRKLRYLDPELTELGETWARKRGVELKPYVSPTTKMFCSTLFRTQLTALLIREEIKKTMPDYNQKINVLPNSSEVHNISSYVDKDNAPLDPTNFVSFEERANMYNNHMYELSSVYTTHPEYNNFAYLSTEYNKIITIFTEFKKAYDDFKKKADTTPDIIYNKEFNRATTLRRVVNNYVRGLVDKYEAEQKEKPQTERDNEQTKQREKAKIMKQIPTDADSVNDKKSKLSDIYENTREKANNLGNKLRFTNPLVHRLMEKQTTIADKESAFTQPHDSKRKAAVASNPAKLKEFLENKNFFILDAADRKAAVDNTTPITIENPELIPTNGSRVKVGAPPKTLTIDHLDAIIVSHGGVMKTIIQLEGGKRPELKNLDAILFRIMGGKIAEAYLLPMKDRQSALTLGISEIDKSCLRNGCQSQSQSQSGGFLQKRTRRQRQRRSSTRRHRRRGQGQP